MVSPLPGPFGFAVGAAAVGPVGAGGDESFSLVALLSPQPPVRVARAKSEAKNDSAARGRRWGDSGVFEVMGENTPAGKD